MHGRSPHEDNHVFGQHNSDLTIRYPINDHRAVFSVKQLDWTPGNLENPNGDVLLAGIARFTGWTTIRRRCSPTAWQLRRSSNTSKNCSSPSTAGLASGLEAAAKRASRKAAKKAVHDDYCRLQFASIRI